VIRVIDFVPCFFWGLGEANSIVGNSIRGFIFTPSAA
jgi:hypothetical protein